MPYLTRHMEALKQFPHEGRPLQPGQPGFGQPTLAPAGQPGQLQQQKPPRKRVRLRASRLWSPVARPYRA